MMLAKSIRISMLVCSLLFALSAESAETDIAVYEAKAEQALKSGYYNRAATYYTRIVRTLPDNIGYRAKLGQIQLQIGNLDQAREQANAILAWDATHKAALKIMSEILLREQNYDEAYVHLQSLVQNYPEDPFGYLGLSSVYSAREDEDAKKEAFDMYRKLTSKPSKDNE